MIKCPYCGKSHFIINSAISTLVYVPTIISEGKVEQQSDPNKTTYNCTCLECYKDFETHEDILNKDDSPIQCDKENSNISINGDVMNKTVKDKEYIDFPVSPYALPDVLLALDNEGITQYWVTKEDNDLHIRIEKDYLIEKVYKIKFKPLGAEEDIPVSPFIKDNLGLNQHSQPNCETCPNKGGLKDAFGNPTIGDSPCDFCPNNPMKVTCINKSTENTNLKDIINNIKGSRVQCSTED